VIPLYEPPIPYFARPYDFPNYNGFGARPLHPNMPVVPDWRNQQNDHNLTPPNLPPGMFAGTPPQGMTALLQMLAQRLR
jgi:hypothetical protein